MRWFLYLYVAFTTLQIALDSVTARRTPARRARHAQGTWTP